MLFGLGLVWVLGCGVWVCGGWVSGWFGVICGLRFADLGARISCLILGGCLLWFGCCLVVCGFWATLVVVDDSGGLV